MVRILQQGYIYRSRNYKYLSDLRDGIQEEKSTEVEIISIYQTVSLTFISHSSTEVEIISIYQTSRVPKQAN